MYQSQNFHNLGTSGHRPASSINYLSHYQPQQQPTSSHYLPPSNSTRLNQHIIQPTMVGFVPPPQVPIQSQGRRHPPHVPPPIHAPLPIMAPQLNHLQMPVYQYPVPVNMTQVVNVPQQNNQEVTGGINTVLEYDLKNMSSFLSWCSFGMLKQNRNPSKEFETLIHSLLVATRLPKSTIIISLEYMNQRFSDKSLDSLTENDIFIKLTVSLILGNKFNDDNTFTNRSWCGATGLNINDLNSEEKKWLSEVNWKLNVVNFESNILTLEECWNTWVEKHLVVEPTSPTSFSSIPSSPSVDYYSPTTSPMRELIWSTKDSHSHPYDVQSNIWSYTPYPEIPPIQYMNSSFVGYSNPYYTFNMASC